MRVLVTGANGFIGGHCVSTMRQMGWQMDGVVRNGASTPAAGLHRVHTSLALQADDLAGVDVIFHLAGLAHDRVTAAQPGGLQAQLHQVNAQATQALYDQAAIAGVPRFIWLSSIKVLGEGKAGDYQVDDPRQPQGLYATSKAAAETSLLANQVPSTQLAIVRPPLVYGPGVKANFLKLMHYARSPWPLPLGGAQQPRAWLSVHNLVDLLIRLAQHNCQGIWHVRDAEQPGTSAMLQQLAAAAGNTSRQWHVADQLVCRLAGMVGRGDLAQRIFGRLTVDMQTTCSALNWQPPYTQAAEVNKAMAWLQAQ
ncbi:MAG: NAD-dependent epimerase/dehydratase family protein [Pseudomonadota bacterium]